MDRFERATVRLMDDAFKRLMKAKDDGKHKPWSEVDTFSLHMGYEEAYRQLAFHLEVHIPGYENPFMADFPNEDKS